MQRQLENLSATHLSSDPKGLDFEGFSYADHLITWRYHPKDLFRPLVHDRTDKAYQHVGHPMTFLTEAIWYDNTEARLTQTAAYGGTTVGNKPFCMGNLTMGVGFKPWIWCCKVPKVLWLQLKWKKSKERMRLLLQESVSTGPQQRALDGCIGLGDTYVT